MADFENQAPADLGVLTAREFIAYRDSLAGTATRLTAAEPLRRKAFLRLLEADRLCWRGLAGGGTLADDEDRYTLTAAGYAALERAHAESGCYPGADWQPEADEPPACALSDEEFWRGWEAAEEQRNFFGLDAEGGRA